MLILLLSQVALAQSAPTQPAFNAQNYRPPIDSEMTLWADDASLKDNGTFGARLWASYTRNPLVYQFSDSSQGSEVLVGNLLQADAIGSATWYHLRLGVDVPIYLLATGTQVNTGTGLGDLSVDLKATLMDTDDAPLGLAVSGRALLPTATVDAPLGASKVGGELAVIADKRVGDLLLVANLGTRFAPQVALENVTLNDELFWRAAAGYAVTDKLGVSLDLAGQTLYSAPLSNPASSPIEGLVGSWQRFGDFVLREGVGTGLTAGVGSPDFRSVLAFAYEPPVNKDTDLDGIVDRNDACPTEPEDKDGWEDEDGCPDPSTHVLFRFVDEDGYAVEAVASQVTGPGIEPMVKDGAYEASLHPGVYHLQVTAPGFDSVEMDSNVPKAANTEIVVTMKAIPSTLVIKTNDPDGNALASQWSLGGSYNDSPRGLAESAVKPGKYVLRVQAPGYQIVREPVELAPGERKELQYTLVPSKIVVTKEKIELKQEVYFDTGKATIKQESFDMLTEVAGVLKDNPDIRKVLIAGNTDSRGSASLNQKLSEARAAAVREFLVGRGVEPNRMDSVGYGESKPLVPGNNEAAWSKNRRVDITITERTPE